MDILEVDNTTVRDAQIARLQKLRAERDSAACEAALEALSLIHICCPAVFPRI